MLDDAGRESAPRRFDKLILVSATVERIALTTRGTMRTMRRLRKTSETRRGRNQRGI